MSSWNKFCFTIWHSRNIMHFSAILLSAARTQKNRFQGILNKNNRYGWMRAGMYRNETRQFFNSYQNLVALFLGSPHFWLLVFLWLVNSQKKMTVVKKSNTLRCSSCQNLAMAVKKWREKWKIASHFRLFDSCHILNFFKNNIPRDIFSPSQSPVLAAVSWCRGRAQA